MSKRELPQVVSDLQAIRDRLTNPEAWSKGLFGTEKSSNCLVGAMDVIIDRDYKLLPSEKFYIEAKNRRTNCRAAISVNIPSGYDGSIVGYNDATRTTHKDILATIDTAIEKEKTKVGIKMMEEIVR